MKTKLYFLFAALFAMATSVSAKITLLEPVITDSYMAFVGENVTNNYRFTLDTYEWGGGRGPQFQLTIEPLDAAKPAQFTTADLSDANYWEPMFRQYTKQMAGEEMTAQENVKRLYVKNVALLPSQFADYVEFHLISIEASGDYTIPDGCFSGCTRLETLDCNVQGTLSLDKGIVSTQPGFTVKVYTKQSFAAWAEYQSSTGANFMVDASGVGDSDAPKILSVSLDLTVNSESRIFDLPDVSGKQQETAPIVGYVFNGFKATTSGAVSELFMEYSIYPATQSGQQHEWKQLHAKNMGGGAWNYEGPVVNVLAGLQSNTEYRLEFTLKTDYNDSYGSTSYPTNGATVRIAFTTGDLSTGVGAVAADGKSTVMFDLQGRRLREKPAGRGILIRNGRKIIVE